MKIEFKAISCNKECWPLRSAYYICQLLISVQCKRYVINTMLVEQLTTITLGDHQHKFDYITVGIAKKIKKCYTRA